jgi:hypothetical protein
MSSAVELDLFCINLDAFGYKLAVNSLLSVKLLLIQWH